MVKHGYVEFELAKECSIFRNVDLFDHESIGIELVDSLFGLVAQRAVLFREES